MPKPPIIVAHRGLHHDLPENSIAAFEAAWAAGITWVECDVHQSADNLVVIHDATFDRTTDGAGPVIDRNFIQIDRLRMRNPAGRLTRHRVPNLRDMLRAMPPAGRLLVEIKTCRDHGQLIRDIQDRTVMVQSFDARHLEEIRRLAPRVPIAYLVETAESLEQSFNLPFDAVHLHHNLLGAAVAKRLRAAGRSIGVWTVNRESQLQRVVRLPVDMLITDQPEMAGRVLGGEQ